MTVKIVKLTRGDELFGEFDPEISVIRHPVNFYVINDGY